MLIALIAVFQACLAILLKACFCLPFRRSISLAVLASATDVVVLSNGNNHSMDYQIGTVPLQVVCNPEPGDQPRNKSGFNSFSTFIPCTADSLLPYSSTSSDFSVTTTGFPFLTRTILPAVAETSSSCFYLSISQVLQVFRPLPADLLGILQLISAVHLSAGYSSSSSSSA